MDPLFPPQPIQPVLSGKKQSYAEIEKPTDSKVRGLVLEKIGEARTGSRGALLPSAAASRIMIDLLSALALPAMMPSPQRKKRVALRKKSGKMAPIGLRRCRPYEWINAWVQFLLFLPSMPEIFSFLPRSFDPFLEFADQYAWDQQEDKSISSANGAALLRCLLRTLHPRLFRIPSRIDLYELLRLFTEAAFPRFSPSFCNAVLFHPEWHVSWEIGEGESFEEEIRRKIKNCPPELLAVVRGGESGFCPILKRQLLFPSSNLCYDLDAFIECRPDVCNAPSYITYVKVGGTWYQCHDDRITPLSSPTLNIPLHGATLLHYTRIFFS